MKVLVKSAWGSDDPTKAAFPFLHANALAEAVHDAQIFLLGEAVSLMRDPVAAAVGGNPVSDGRAWHTDPRVRRMFKGSWSPRGRSGGKEGYIR